MTCKTGDDYPARLYITFANDPGKVSLGKKIRFKTGQAIFVDGSVKNGISTKTTNWHLSKSRH